jgi:hypothetical protein
VFASRINDDYRRKSLPSRRNGTGLDKACRRTKHTGSAAKRISPRRITGARHPAERLVHPHPAKFHRDATLVGRAINRDSRLKRNPLPSTAFRDSLPIHQDKNAFSRHGLYYNNRFFGSCVACSSLSFLLFNRPSIGYAESTQRLHRCNLALHD